MHVLWSVLQVSLPLGVILHGIHRNRLDVICLDVKKKKRLGNMHTWKRRQPIENINGSLHFNILLCHLCLLTRAWNKTSKRTKVRNARSKKQKTHMNYTHGALVGLKPANDYR